MPIRKMTALEVAIDELSAAVERSKDGRTQFVSIGMSAVQAKELLEILRGVK